MWERIKRLINSYLDALIERSSRADSEVRDLTRAEIARLNELEVQALASAKLIEKEGAEIELKIVGLSERERISREKGDLAAATSAANALPALLARRELLKKQLDEANASAARARLLREECRVTGDALASETHLTSMRENLAGIQSPFDSSDPAATIEEMRARLNKSGFPESRVDEADRQLEAELKRSRADELLARYKHGLAEQPAAVQPNQPIQSDPGPAAEKEEPEQPKTLGRAEEPLRPID